MWALRESAKAVNPDKVRELLAKLQDLPEQSDNQPTNVPGQVKRTAVVAGLKFLASTPNADNTGAVRQYFGTQLQDFFRDPAS